MCAPTPHPPHPHDLIGDSVRTCRDWTEREARSWVCNSPSVQPCPYVGSRPVCSWATLLLLLSACGDAADSDQIARLAMPEPMTETGPAHLRPVALGLGRRHGHRRHRLGPDLLGRRPLPPPQRRRDPGADALQPAAGDLLHDRADHDGDRLLLLDRQGPERGHRARPRARPDRRGRRPAVVLDVQLRLERGRRHGGRDAATRLRRHRLADPDAVCCRSTRPSSSTCTRPT